MMERITGRTWLRIVGFIVFALTVLWAMAHYRG